MPFDSEIEKIKAEFDGKVTDKFLELLLKGMEAAFAASKNKIVSIFYDKFKDYHKNIEGFKGRYLFRTSDNTVLASAVFENGDMDVREDIDDWNVRVTFKNPAALRDFLFSQNQDILDSILANTVEVDGNLSYIYKFGFMARDIRKRIGL